MDLAFRSDRIANNDKESGDFYDWFPLNKLWESLLFVICGIGLS